MIFVKYKNKYRIYHPVFWNTHTCLYFPTHVWFLPNTLTCLMYLVKSTHVVKTTHMIVQVIIGNSHTCLVFTTHMEVVEISVNFHTCVVFTKQPEWDPSLNNFHSKLLSYFEQFPFLSILISFIFEFFGSLGTKTLLLHKFSFWYRNTILFYILSLDVRFQENCLTGCKVTLVTFVCLCTVEKNHTTATSVVMHPLCWAIWKCTMEKSRANATMSR